MDAGKAAILRIYSDETAFADDAPLHMAIIERARQAHLAGVTVWRGVVGLGARGHVQRAGILDFSGNLPIVIEIIDDEPKLRDFAATLVSLKAIGLVTLEAVEILHRGHEPLGAA